MAGTIITFAIVLLVLVLVHELGHFIAAKMMGIKVEEFGFGLPPRAIGKKIGETLYSLNWPPIGGFVRVYGEDVEDPSQIKKDRNRAFFSKKPWQRAIVLIAGVIINLLLAWIIISYLLTQGVPVPGDTVYVQSVAEGSPAEEVGIRVDDEVIAVTDANGEEYSVKEPQDLINVTGENVGHEVVITIVRDGEEMAITIVPREDPPEGEGSMGVVISNLEEKVYPWYQAPVVGLKHTVGMLVALVTGFAGIIARLVTFQPIGVEIAGPIGIGGIVGEARQFGANAVLEVTAILSLNLALLNILPFPALDGGRLLFVVIEGVTGKKVKSQWERNTHQVGMLLLLILLLLITVKDIMRIIGI